MCGQDQACKFPGQQIGKLAKRNEAAITIACQTRNHLSQPIQIVLLSPVRPPGPNPCNAFLYCQFRCHAIHLLLLSAELRVPGTVSVTRDLRFTSTYFVSHYCFSQIDQSLSGLAGEHSDCGQSFLAPAKTRIRSQTDSQSQRNLQCIQKSKLTQPRTHWRVYAGVFVRFTLKHQRSSCCKW